MNNLLKSFVLTILIAFLVSGCDRLSKSLPKDKPINVAEMGYDQDFRTFYADGNVEYGKIGDSFSADLVMYVAGSQYMVMDELIKDFQRKYPKINTIYVATIPAGEILKNYLLASGQVNGQAANQTPDLFASVNLGQLMRLRGAGVMTKYMVYAHNKLELMVAAGNPKQIKGLNDLVRDDLVQSHPNPVYESIFGVYGRRALERAKISDKVSFSNKRCVSCWVVPNKVWFTQRYYRDTPFRIENASADVGIVWSSDVYYAKAQGRAVEGVAISARYNMLRRVKYAIAPLNKARNKRNAITFIRYLATEDAQDIYSKYGFIKASQRERKMRFIPKPRRR